MCSSDKQRFVSLPVGTLAGFQGGCLLTSRGGPKHTKQVAAAETFPTSG